MRISRNLGGSLLAATTARAPSVGENVMETSMPRLVADHRGKEKFFWVFRTFFAMPRAFRFWKEVKTYRATPN